MIGLIIGIAIAVAAAAVAVALVAASRDADTNFPNREVGDICEDCESTRCRGNPLHEQEQPMSCVLASSRMIIQQRTGADPGEAVLRDEASEDGWYDAVNGSDPWQIPTLLENYGVDGARAENGLTVDDLDQATSGGQPAMVGLKNPGHRIIVDGVQTNDDGSRTILVRDPGYSGDDGCREVPEDEFLERYNSNAPVIRFD